LRPFSQPFAFRFLVVSDVAIDFGSVRNPVSQRRKDPFEWQVREVVAVNLFGGNPLLV
jgi:hypothetical protein